MEKKANSNIVAVSDNNSVNVEVSIKTADAASMIEKLHEFFNEEDQYEIYLQDSEEIFTKLTSAIQGMIGCEAYWNIVEK